MTQFFADVEKLTNKSKGQYGLGIDGTDVWNVSPYIWSDGGAFTNAKLTDGPGLHERQGDQPAARTARQPDKAGDIGSDFLGGAGAVSGETGIPEG